MEFHHRGGRGRARILRDKDAVVDGLRGIAAAADPSRAAPADSEAQAMSALSIPRRFEIDIDEMVGVSSCPRIATIGIVGW
ncbi:hypothetical protein I552_0714, partial [Mycobacterium xenopi 3993]